MSIHSNIRNGVNVRDSDAAPVGPAEPTSGLGTAGLGAWCVAGELVTDAEVSEPAEVPPGLDTPADCSPRSEMKYFPDETYLKRNRQSSLLMFAHVQSK